MARRLPSPLRGNFGAFSGERARQGVERRIVEPHHDDAERDRHLQRDRLALADDAHYNHLRHEVLRFLYEKNLKVEDDVARGKKKQALATVQLVDAKTGTQQVAAAPALHQVGAAPTLQKVS